MPAGSRLVSAFGAYTSSSRHREKNFILTSDGAERAEIIGRRPFGDRREANRSDVLDNLTRNFARQPEKESALNLMDRAAGLRRGTVRATQSSLQSLEANAAAPTLPERLVLRRIIKMLEERLPGLAARLCRQGKTIGELAYLGRAIAQRIAEIARWRASKIPDAKEYLQQVVKSPSLRRQNSEIDKQNERRGRKR